MIPTVFISLGLTLAMIAAEKARKEAEEAAEKERLRALIDTSAENVFAITLYCVDTYYENRAIDFLEPMFQVSIFVIAIFVLFKSIDIKLYIYILLLCSLEFYNTFMVLACYIYFARFSTAVP